MDDNVVDSLRIEVEGDTSSAVKGLERIVALLDKIKSAATGTDKALDSLQSKLDKIAGSSKGTGSKSNPFASPVASAPNPTYSGDTIVPASKVEDTSSAVEGLSSAISSNQSMWENLARIAGAATQKIREKARDDFGKFGTFAAHAAKKAATALAKFTVAPLTAIGKKFSGLKDKLNGLLKMFKRRLAYRAINAIITAVTQGIKEGTSNLYQFSKALNGALSQSLDKAATSLLYFKNSLGAMLAPIINMLVPVLERVIEKVIDAFNFVNRIMAKLSGATTWTKALKYQTQYAEAAADANEKLKKSLLGIDELNILQDKSSDSNALDYSKMFEEQEIGEIKNPFANFFAPFKSAWDTVGKSVVESIETTFRRIKGVFGSIGRSFKAIWADGTAQETLENILGVVKSISDSFGSLGAAISRAWDKNNVGTRILKTILRTVNRLLKYWQDMYTAIANWFDSLDLSPLLESLAQLTDVSDSLTGVFGDTILWLFKDVLLPIGKWITEDLAPAVVGLLSSIVRVIKDILQPILLPLLKAIWTLLQPILNVIEKIVVFVVNVLKSAFEKIAATLEEKGPKIQQIFDDLGTIFGLIADTWKELEPVFNYLLDYLGDVFTFFNDIGGTAIGVFIDGLHGVIEFITGIFTLDWEKAWNGLNEVLNLRMNAAKKLFSNFTDFLKNVGSTVAKNFVNIANGILGSIERMVNGVINGINNMIRALNKLSFTIPDWVPVLGGKSFGFNLGTIGTVTIPRIPTAAEGGQFDNGQLFIAREAGAELVGNIGGRASVANNEQIVAGISDGVREANGEVVSAIWAALQQVVQAIREQNADIYLDGDKVGKKLTSSQNRANRVRGAVQQNI